MTSDNPVFGIDAAQRYRDEYYRQAITPLVDQERINQAMTGNADSTYGATAVGNMAIQGANQAFFAGEDYRNQLINQSLARRDSLYGNEGRIAQEQNSLDIQRGLGVEGIKSDRLGMLNNQRANTAGLLTGMYNNRQQQEADLAVAKAQSRASLFGGLLGLGGGLIGGAMGKRQSTPTGISNNSGGAFSSIDPYFSKQISFNNSGGFRF